MASSAAPPATAPPTSPTLVDAISAVNKVFSSLEQHQYYLLLLLPYAAGWFNWSAASGSQYHPELWYLGMLLTFLTVVGFVAPTRYSSGPLRWAYLEGSGWYHPFMQHLPKWSANGTLIALLFFPVLRIWAFAVVPIAWQYIIYRYRSGVRDITEKAEESCYRAAIAAQAATEHVKDANQFETQALAIVANARRDSRLIETLRVTDFFDVAQDSWSALGQITAPLEDARKQAGKMLEEAEACQDVDPNESDDGSSTADMLSVAAKAAHDAFERMENHARRAQAKVHESGKAVRRDEKTRSDEAQNAQKVTTVVKGLRVLVESMGTDAAAVATAYRKVKWNAEQAKLLAEGGDFAIASARLTEAGKEANLAVAAETRLLSTKQKARSTLWNSYTG